MIYLHSIGEESYSGGTRPPLTDAPTFCVDPIGTQSPYLCAFPPRRIIVRSIVRPSCKSDLDGTHRPPLCRRDDQLRARFPLCMHLARSDRPAHPSPRRNLQSLPRPSLHRRARRRLLPTHAYAAGAATPPARAGAPAAQPRERAHCRRVGLEPQARGDARQGPELHAARRSAATRRHGTLAALDGKCRPQLFARRARRTGHVLVCVTIFIWDYLADGTTWARDP